MIVFLCILAKDVLPTDPHRAARFGKSPAHLCRLIASVTVLEAAFKVIQEFVAIGGEVGLRDDNDNYNVFVVEFVKSIENLMEKPHMAAIREGKKNYPLMASLDITQRCMNVLIKRAPTRLSRIMSGTEALVKFYFFDLICASESASSETSKSKFLAHLVELVKS
jgi:hypothetical protein